VTSNLHACCTCTDIPLEMLLVLGNPGAGCTSLLSILSNHRLGYAEVNGDVSFGAMSSEEANAYRGQISKYIKSPSHYIS